MSIYVSVVIPAHNEADRLRANLPRLFPVLRDLGLERVELLIVDDGSTDDTGVVATDLTKDLPNARVLRVEVNAGKGSALRTGFAVADGAVVVAMDADLAIDPRHLPALLASLESHDVVIGSRADGHRIRYDSIARTAAGWFFNVLVRRWTGLVVRDTQCGFKGYRTGVGRTLANLGFIDGFAFDPEWLYLAEQLGLRVTSIPVTWDDVAGSSVRVGRDSFKMLRDIRDIAGTTYQTVGVTVPRESDVEALRTACVLARVHGAAIGRGRHDDLVVLPRDAAPGALGIARTCNGTMSVVHLRDLRGRTFESI